jgi:hypothetical protein
MQPSSLRKKTDGQRRVFGRRRATQKTTFHLNAIDNLAEYIADCGTKDGQNDDDNNGDQNQNQCVLYETLAFPLLFEHGTLPPFLRG